MAKSGTLWPFVLHGFNGSARQKLTFAIFAVHQLEAGETRH
jgi:hypothetical protein